MSTNYYRLRAPISSIRVEEGPGHDRITVFERGANAGTLTLSCGEGRTLARLFADRDERPAPLCTHWGGKDIGTVVTVHDALLTDDTIVISDYGDVLTVATVKRRAGAGRGSSNPADIGELFGYRDDGAAQSKGTT